MNPKEADRLVLKQAILRHKERQDRQKREIPIPKGDGWVIKGSMYDCSRESFQRSLEAYSDRLYVGWNPMKNEGRGCWEVWHRPSRKTLILSYHDEKTGFKIYRAEYQPNDFEHWVADLPYLSRDFIQRLREMDTWSNKHLTAQHDDQYEEMNRRAEDKENENIKYVVRHNKQAFRDLLDYVQEGYHPVQFFNKK